MRRFAVAVFLCGSLPVYAWGPVGHDLVARLAAAHLTPAASARVAEILGPGTSMASISSWADQIRRERAETGPWHYIDIEITNKHLDMTRDCPKGDCIIAKLAEFRKVVVDPSATAVARKEALMFIVHFVGDMHQPLHCADNHDKGGNDVKLDFFGRPSNLHSIWDSGLLGRTGDEEKLFAVYTAELTPKNFRKWSKGSVEDWAEKSHKAAVKVVYGKLPKPPVAINAQYEALADSVVKEQIERAGARLAAVLNATFK